MDKDIMNFIQTCKRAEASIKTDGSAIVIHCPYMGTPIEVNSFGNMYDMIFLLSWTIRTFLERTAEFGEPELANKYAQNAVRIITDKGGQQHYRKDYEI